MIRVLIYLFIVCVVTVGGVWLAERPGEVAITWQGVRVETSVMVALVAVVAIAVAVTLLWSLIRAALRWPEALARKRQTRRGARGYQAVSQGLIAVASGDMRAAKRFTDEARRLAPSEPLTLLLGAQTAQLAGDRPSAERAFHVMAARDDTKLLGLHGLYIEAQRHADPVAAHAYAEEAAKHTAPPSWAGQAALEYRCATGDWTGALDRLERNQRSGLVDKASYRRQRAVLLTAQALAAAEHERTRARDLAVEAAKLAPTLVPAAALAGSLLGEAGELRKAARIIEAAWKDNPHPDLAEAYAHLRPGASARERLTRIEALAKLAPGNVEAALAVARAAIDAQEFTIAREALTPLATTPSQRVALLMSELEETEHADEGRAREWMARALSARRDPAWTADGYVSDRWLPVSPVTGRLDAFEWKDPLSGLEGGVAMIEAHPRTELAVAAPAHAAGTASPRLPGDGAPRRAEHYEGAAQPDPPVVAGGRPLPVKDAEREHTDPAAPTSPRSPTQAEPRLRAVPTSTVVALPPRIEKVIPLVHVPDDPGPDQEAQVEPAPEPASEPPSDSWTRIRQLFKP
jgi:HemY protein